MQSPNFLILDEPTNDLDISTLEVLEDYLGSYNGSVIIVSHDRYFIDSLVDHIFVFEGNGAIKDFPGNYSDYIEWKQKTKKETAQKKEPAPINKQIKTAVPTKMTFKEKMEFEELEKAIESLESEKQILEDVLNSGTLSPKELQEKSERFGEIIKILDLKSERWFELAEKKGM
jgi:ATP-binding cassette subfamily F protein uup